MALPDVTINLDNGNLGGSIDFAEGVCGFIGTGVSVVDGIQVGAPALITDLDSAKAIGVTEADNPAAYRQLKEFYAELGGEMECYVMLVPDTMAQADMFDVSNANGAKVLLDYAQGRIRLLGSFFTPPGGYSPVLDAGFDEDAITAIVNGQVLSTTYAQAQAPFRAFVSVNDFQGDAATVPSMRERSENRVQAVLASTAADGVPALGLRMGRYARNPVQRKPSRVKDGGVASASAYVGDTAIEDLVGLSVLHDKGYAVLRTFAGKAGYYWSGDATCAPATDDYGLMTRGRVIDKAQVFAYTTYVNELDDEVLVSEDGKLAAGYVKYMEGIIENAIGLNMVGPGEISNIEAVIDLNQNILSDPVLRVAIRVTPVGYATNIEVLLGYFNPALNT